MQRRLATILSADVAGYSSRMGENETETIDRVSTLSDLIYDKAKVYDGRVFNRAGDGFMAEFPSPVSAVRAAYELQQELAVPSTFKKIGLQIRIGLHLADVVADGRDLLGDGVNIANRIEAIAEPGSVLVSGTLFECVKRNAQLRFEFLGEKELKNISEPISVYRVLGELGNHSCVTALMRDDAASAPQAQAQANSVIVIPFENGSSDPDQEYFADGFSEDLITELARFQDVLTISRNASFGLKGKNKPVQEVGRELGVQFCLEGSIRKLGSKVRISCYLADAASGEQIWSARHDCDLDELFDVQDELAARIVASVAGQIERRAEAAALRKRPRDLQAYDCLLRGLEYHRIGGVTRENAEQALRWFDQAIEKDPQFGRAHAWRACALSTVAEWTGQDVWDELVEIGRLAVELDEADAECHRIAGSLGLYQKDYDSALYHFNRALELNPHHAYLVGRMGEIHNFLGDGETALEYQKRAKVLDPFLPEYCRELEVVAYYVLGDFTTCFRVVGEFTRLTRRAAAYRAAAAVHLGDPEGMRMAAFRLLETDPEFDPSLFIQTEFYRDESFAEQLRSDLAGALQSLLRLVG